MTSCTFGKTILARASFDERVDRVQTPVKNLESGMVAVRYVVFLFAHGCMLFTKISKELIRHFLEASSVGAQAALLLLLPGFELDT